MVRKEFKIPCMQTIQKSTTDNNELIITGVANSGLEDLVGDVVTREALEKIAEQIPYHNLHLDHGRGFDDILGPLLEGWIDDKGYLNYIAKIIREKSDMINSYLEQGVNFGSSIAGACEYEENNYSNIIDWDLTEVSLTDIPCDQNTMATVQIAKSFVDIITDIKKLKDEGDEGMAEDAVTNDEVIEMINAAINEVREDLAKEVIDQVKAEYEAQINELKERIESLESQDNAGEGEGTEGAEGTEGTSTGEGEGNTGEGKAGGNDEDEDEDEDEDKKAIQELIAKTVQDEIKKAFGDNKPSFTYTPSKKDNKQETETKKYTPEEIANIMAGEI